MRPAPHATALSIPDLRQRFPGRVASPDDADYDAARQLMYGGLDIRPAVIIRVRDADDCRRVVELAHETGLPLAVRSGGHSAAGHGSVEHGIVLDLSQMKAMDVDPSTRTAWAETGLTAREVSSAAEEHGLGIGFGDTGSVGIGGITLGGGVGYLARKAGLTIDSLLGAELVTAGGELLTVNADSHPDLFWAIRGGGGNFGVATRFHYRLHPLGEVVGGMIMLPATAETVAGFIAAAHEASEDLSAIANVMPAPPMPFVPSEHQGKLVIFGLMVHAGDRAAGEAAMQPFRSLAPPVADMLKPMAYTEIYPPEDPSYHPVAVSMNMHIDHVDLDVARTIVEHLEASDAPLRVAQLRVLGGAMARVPADATAYAHRSSRIMVNLAAFHDGTPEDRARRQGWVDDFARAIDQGDPAVYVNFLMDEGPARVHAAYPGPTWDRLVEIKRRYDPGNLFHRNQNIPPSG